MTSSPAFSEGIVYVGSVGGSIYALNASTGDKIWNYFTNPTSYGGGGYSGGVQASPAVANGVVYVGSVDGAMYALNASNGKQLWADSLFRILSSAAVSNGVVYVGAYEDVYALNATTGAYIWDFQTKNQIISSPAIFNGALYIGSQDGNFYAIGEQSKPSVISSQTLLGVLAVSALVIVVTFIALKKRYRKPQNHHSD